MNGPRRYLIAGPAWVGDMVMAQSLFITLRRQYPDAIIDVLAPEWSLPLLERMPEVRAGIPLPVAHGELALRKRWRLGRALRRKGYTHAIVIPRSAKAALVPFFAGVPVRTGYRGELRYGLLNDIRPLDKQVLGRTVQRMVALGLPATAPQPPQTPYPHLRIDAENRERLFAHLGLRAAPAPVALLPGAAYGPAKQWPLEHWQDLARRLLARGLPVWIFGSETERPLGDAIAGAGEGATNLCGRTTLTDTVDLLAACRAAISNDSGLMHVACATGIPVVGIYGSSTPAYTPPLSERAEVVYLDLDCSPCFERTCPRRHTRCLTKIDPDQVFTHIDRMLSP